MALLQSALLPSSPGALVSLEGRHPGSTVVWLRGDHDLSTTLDLTDVIAGAIATADADLVIDLSQIEFFDVTTVGVIVRAHHYLHARSRSLVVRSPTPRAERVLRLCGVGDLIGGGPSPDLAVVGPDAADPPPSALRGGP